jgi:GntR family transcriptional regulator, transcriptional repressor for pyruvate dehydrogenase complex
VSPRLLPFTPPARRRLHEDVAEQLRDAILDGRFPAGQRLPPERELAVEFRVNRTSVREAIKVLENSGLVTVRQGDGATVQPLVDATLDTLGAMIFHGGRLDLAMLAEMREVVMPLLLDMGRLAIERRQPADLDRVRALRVVIADEALEPEARFTAVRELPVVLADMTRNRVWQMLARRVRAFLSSPPMRAARQRLQRDPGRFVPLLDACLDCLAAGHEAKAVTCLQELIRLVGDPLAATPATAPTQRTRGART